MSFGQKCQMFRFRNIGKKQLKIKMSKKTSPKKPRLKLNTIKGKNVINC